MSRSFAEVGATKVSASGAPRFPASVTGEQPVTGYRLGRVADALIQQNLSELSAALLFMNPRRGGVRSSRQIEQGTEGGGPQAGTQNEPCPPLGFTG